MAPRTEYESIQDEHIEVMAKVIHELLHKHKAMLEKTPSKPELDELGLKNIDKVLNKLHKLKVGPERYMLYMQLKNTLTSNKDFDQFNKNMMSSLQWKGMSSKNVETKENVTLASLVVKADAKFNLSNNESQSLSPNLESKDINNESQVVNRPITSMQDLETGRAIRSSTKQISNPGPNKREVEVEDMETGKATRTRPKPP